MENWKKIVINNQETFYSVSDKGRVRNDSTGTILSGSISNNGYHMVKLRRRVDKYCSVHRLVMKAFKPVENMDDLQVNHIDGNKLNNNLENLEWSTALENMLHSFRNDLQKKNLRAVYQYDLEGNFIQEYESAAEAARFFENGDSTNILRCLNEEQTIYRGYQFKSYKKNKIPSWSNSKTNEVYLYTDAGEFVKAYSSQKECAKDVGVAPSTVSLALRGKRKIKGVVLSKIPR